jgi:multicomponent Na+:H+ antiporter subunit B
MKVSGALAIGAFALALVIAGTGMPPFGDVHAPAAGHVAQYFLEHGWEDAHTPNIVTVMIADYRGFDTLGETVVVFTAGLACWLLLPRRRPAPESALTVRKDSLIVDVVTRMMVPIIMIFALYVVFHGHYSPGGGFQGGALMAGATLLARVVLGRERSESVLPVWLGTPLGLLGIAIYAGFGLGGLVFGGGVLEYDALPLASSAAMRRNWGILGVEIGVAFAVMGTLVSIFDDLTTGAAGGRER